MLTEFLLFVNLIQPPPQVAQIQSLEHSMPYMSLSCSDHQKFVDHLKHDGGALLFTGLSNNTTLEIWHKKADPDDPWVAFLTTSDGKACVVSLGSGFSYPGSPTNPKSNHPDEDVHP